MYDVAIVGGGPAGLNAALMLGRARRRTLLLDAGRPRNAVSHAMHGFLSRDGADPAEVRRLGRQELDRYDTVEVRQDAFIFADLIIIPIINIHRKYYGWRASLYLLGLSYVAMAGAGLAVEL